MPKQPPHESVLHKLLKQLLAMLPEAWELWIRSPVTLTDGNQKPDMAIVRQSIDTYETRYPNSADIGLLLEVSDSTLFTDQIEKHRIYARSRIPIYWLVNLIDRQIEVYEQPSGPLIKPTYASTGIYVPGESVPVMLDGQFIGHIAVNAVLPSA